MGESIFEHENPQASYKEAIDSYLFTLQGISNLTETLQLFHQENLKIPQSRFSQIPNIGKNGNIGIRCLITRKQKNPATYCYLQWTSAIQVERAPVCANLAVLLRGHLNCLLILGLR